MQRHRGAPWGWIITKAEALNSLPLHLLTAFANCFECTEESIQSSSACFCRLCPKLFMWNIVWYWKHCTWNLKLFSLGEKKQFSNQFLACRTNWAKLCHSISPLVALHFKSHGCRMNSVGQPVWRSLLPTQTSQQLLNGLPRNFTGWLTIPGQPTLLHNF